VWLAIRARHALLLLLLLAGGQLLCQPEVAELDLVLRSNR